MWKELWNTIVSALYPPRCPLCDSFVDRPDIPCVDCETTLHPLPAPALFPHLDRVAVDACRSAFAYEGRIRSALVAFKYSKRLDLRRYLAGCLAREWESLPPASVIVPVPLSPQRLRQRGFNQAALLAASLSRIVHVPARVDLLERIRDHAPQVGKDRKERIGDMKGGFAVPDKHAGDVKGARCVVLDDVATTGATLNACADALKRAGAESVVALTVARTL